MALFPMFPWSDFHRLNLDWILRIIGKFRGGTAGQALVKKSDDDYDFEWSRTPAGTIEVGTVTTLPYGSDATVVNVGTPEDAILNFGLPEGSPGTSTKLAVPARSWNHITTQTEFELYLDELNKGEASWNAYFDAPGTYKIQLPNDTSRVVFTSVQLHWISTVDNVTIDMNEAIFYTSHIHIEGVTKTMGSTYTTNLINTGATVPYFEGCTLLMSYVTIAMILRMWSCYSTIALCRFTNDNENPATFTTSVDVVQGVLFCYNTYFDYDYDDLAVSDFAIFGICNSPTLKFAGRIAIKDCASDRTDIYMFRHRQQKCPFELYIQNSFYNIALGGAYNNSTRRGHIQPALFSDMAAVAYASAQSAIDQFGYVLAAGTSFQIDFVLPTTKTFS